MTPNDVILIAFLILVTGFWIQSMKFYLNAKRERDKALGELIKTVGLVAEEIRKRKQ